MLKQDACRMIEVKALSTLKHDTCIGIALEVCKVLWIIRNYCAGKYRYVPFFILTTNLSSTTHVALALFTALRATAFGEAPASTRMWNPICKIFMQKSYSISHFIDWIWKGTLLSQQFCYIFWNSSLSCPKSTLWMISLWLFGWSGTCCISLVQFQFQK